MEHLHEEIDPLDIDKAGYYVPRMEELFHGMVIEYKGNNGWQSTELLFGDDIHPKFWEYELRVKYLQASDIMDLGFPRLAPSIPMYQRGSYTISAYRLLDPTYSRLLISQNGVRVFEGHVKNKSELKRILILNEINFADN